MPEAPPTFTIRDARLLFRNFEGRADRYNDKGDRNFNVVLDPDVARQMHADGWNVKFPEPRDVDGEMITRDPILAVKVSFDNYPPHITIISNGVRTQVDQNMVEMLDTIEYKKVDLVCRGYSWDVNGKSGIKAYLKTMFVTLNLDELEMEYAMQEAEANDV